VHAVDPPLFPLQCKLFHSIKPLFANKPTFVVINKIDVVRPEDLEPSKAALLDSLTSDASQPVTLLQLSCLSSEGVMDVRNACCDALLAHRVEGKEKTKRADSVLNRIRVAQPTKRDGAAREPFIPAAVASRKKYDRDDPERRLLERDLEEQGGGAGVHSVDLKSAWPFIFISVVITDAHGVLCGVSLESYLLKNPEWNHDVVPEIIEGKNIADFVDPDILERLEELEREEVRLQAEGFYEDDDGMVRSESSFDYLFFLRCSWRGLYRSTRTKKRSTKQPAASANAEPRST
jgi:nucleolar GTP-binding protein